MESGVADFENLRTGVEIVKMGVKTLVGAALPCKYISFIVIFNL